MQKRILVRNSPIHGKGVFAQVDISPGQRVAQYRGVVKSSEDAEADDLHGIDSGHTFLFSLNDQFLLDATRSRCAAKWFNHSCQPNCESVLYEHDSDDRSLDRIMFHAIRPIAPGDELTLSYGICLPVRHTKRMQALWACRCGADTCSGTMLAPR
ncbi:hypothetical protein SAMN05428989_1613 [Pseudoxanthomonas sp. GM95]|uniref:SET domain-containing protein n=1 Tax=Pseudoxanthomonas sp. GM95 TaxID=1881043 RepID=UPI0008B7D4D7|nr:SET domain-containing protein [Pseudoxanthomonas sp. GM95]SEL17809.1 hypothetical protein SAMN05428989_1613 [Pseudoxanthomonas sp. GM95]